MEKLICTKKSSLVMFCSRKNFLKVQIKNLFPRDCSPWSGEQKTYISYAVWIKTDDSIKRKLKKWVLPPPWVTFWNNLVQMLTKCYPTSKGCSCDFTRLKVWLLGVPKPYRTSSYDVLSLLRRSTLFVFVFNSTNFLKNPRYHANRWSRHK